MTVTLTKTVQRTKHVTQHEVIVKETESETDNKLTTSNKIVIDPAVERDLYRREAIVMGSYCSTKKTHSTRMIPP